MKTNGADSWLHLELLTTGVDCAVTIQLSSSHLPGLKPINLLQGKTVCPTNSISVWYFLSSALLASLSAYEI